VHSLEHTEVNLSMPRFSYEFNLPLTDALIEMGMPEAFSDQADFSGIADEPLFISAALHKAFIAVDESGTEAAAATVLMFETTALPARPIELKLDHPFIYAIYDRQTNSVLFLGRVLNPAG
ncbi:MAG TPA: serpin family protein, partial [Phototrophicaceae bacterium]|nr:serpin family protein [Phototrophicaceae bacterium]